jgi:hypothetical protein
MHRTNRVELVTLQASIVKRQEKNEKERNIKESAALIWLRPNLWSPKLHCPHHIYSFIQI